MGSRLGLVSGQPWGGLSVSLRVSGPLSVCLLGVVVPGTVPRLFLDERMWQRPAGSFPAGPLSIPLFLTVTSGLFAPAFVLTFCTCRLVHWMTAPGCFARKVSACGIPQAGVSGVWCPGSGGVLNQARSGPSLCRVVAALPGSDHGGRSWEIAPESRRRGGNVLPGSWGADGGFDPDLPRSGAGTMGLWEGGGVSVLRPVLPQLPW